MHYTKVHAIAYNITIGFLFKFVMLIIYLRLAPKLAYTYYNF